MIFRLFVRGWMGNGRDHPPGTVKGHRLPISTDDLMNIAMGKMNLMKCLRVLDRGLVAIGKVVVTPGFVGDVLHQN